MTPGRKPLFKILKDFGEFGVDMATFPLCQVTDFKMLLAAFQIKRVNQ